jgi:FkbM family methyltransferase
MYAIPSAKRVGPDGQVIAIDASPENILMTKKNAGLNGLTNVIALNLAISDSEGESAFYLTEQGSSGTLVKGSKFGQIDHQLIVKTSTLDALVSSLNLEKEIQLIKVDIEGSEVECIRGGRHTLQKTKYLVIECHNMQNKKEIERIVNDSFTLNEIDYKPGLDTFHILCTKK